MADGWRSSYLARRGLGDEASEAEIEAEFWKLVGSDPPEDDVKVRAAAAAAAATTTTATAAAAVLQ